MADDDAVTRRLEGSFSTPASGGAGAAATVSSASRRRVGRPLLLAHPNAVNQSRLSNMHWWP